MGLMAFGEPQGQIQPDRGTGAIIHLDENILEGRHVFLPCGPQKLVGSQDWR